MTPPPDRETQPGPDALRPAPRAYLVTWDWRAQPDLTRLAELIHQLSGGTVHMREVETSDDEFAVVVANRPQSGLELEHYWAEYRHHGTEEWTW